MKREVRRKKEGRRHVVEYFHQVDDGYSHLAIQMLRPLVQAYDVDLVVHLVRGLTDANIPEPALLQDLSCRDSALIAAQYGLTFPSPASVPKAPLVTLAQSILVLLDARAFATEGVAVSDCLWRGDWVGLKALAARLGSAPEAAVIACIEKGTARRAALKHYSGAMFYYEGEWYWGVDRLSHLEKRLHALAATRSDDVGLIAPKPGLSTTFAGDVSKMTLEYFVSLRSPYTAISWEPTLALVHASGIQLSVRPVLPMVMRGVPATFQKAFYVWADVFREARDLGVEFGDFYDPIGKPVEQGYSLYMWAVSKGRGNALLGAFLKAAFAKGINTNNRAGIRWVVEMAGLEWQEAQHRLADDSWHEVVERNRQAMYASGIWGVPSYRLLDQRGEPILSTWGQDRLWLVSRRMAQQA